MERMSQWGDAAALCPPVVAALHCAPLLLRHCIVPPVVAALHSEHIQNCKLDGVPDLPASQKPNVFSTHIRRSHLFSVSVMLQVAALRAARVEVERELTAKTREVEAAQVRVVGSWLADGQLAVRWLAGAGIQGLLPYGPTPVIYNYTHISCDAILVHHCSQTVYFYVLVASASAGPYMLVHPDG